MNKEYKTDLVGYEELVERLAERYPDITLPPEYAELFQVNTLMVLIKLARYKFPARMVTQSDNVLDVGSGNGIGTIFLGQHAQHVTGLEIRETDHVWSKRVNKRENVTFLNQDFREYDTGLLHDVVVSMDVIEHMPVEDGHKFVQKIAGHLTDGGMAIIGTPSIHSYPYQSAYSQAAHIKCYDCHELLEVMSPYFDRVLSFSMNDELVHTGHPKMAWYYFMIGMYPKRTK